MVYFIHSCVGIFYFGRSSPFHTSTEVCSVAQARFDLTVFLLLPACAGSSGLCSHAWLIGNVHRLGHRDIVRRWLETLCRCVGKNIPHLPTENDFDWSKLQPSEDEVNGFGIG